MLVTLESVSAGASRLLLLVVSQVLHRRFVFLNRTGVEFSDLHLGPTLSVLRPVNRFAKGDV